MKTKEVKAYDLIKPYLNWRLIPIYLLGTIALLGIVSAPLDDSETWFTDFFVSKTIGFGAGYLCWKLGEYWGKRGKINLPSDDDFDDYFDDED